MKTAKRLGFLILLMGHVLLATNPGAAPGPALVDLEMQATLHPPGPINPGATVRLELNVINHGPSDALDASAVSSEFLFLRSAQFDFEPVAPHPCSTVFDDIQAPPGTSLPSYARAVIQLDPIPAGTGVRCTFDIVARGNALGQFEWSFTAHVVTDGLEDSNQANNTATVLLNFARVGTVPAWNAWGAAALVLLLMFAAMFALRRALSAGGASRG